jgi:DNA-binding transcriptional MerR regulator/DNA-directed RNA polymerase subunit RPC12/RpoP
MSKYTTGQLAKQCDVSVRTVQFYDTKGLLKPSELTEGGRRLYSEDDLKKFNTICLLKTLGLSLNSIKGILESDNPNKLLTLLLYEQKRQIDSEIKSRQCQIDAIEIIEEDIEKSNKISVNSINDIEHIMNGKKKLKKTYTLLTILAIIMGIIQYSTLILWITQGMWWAFVIGMIIVSVLAIILVKVYYKNTSYICPQCEVKFKPTMKQFTWAPHTPKTRKLTCPECGYRGFCVETYSDENL